MTYMDFFNPGMPWYVLAGFLTLAAIMVHVMLAALAKAFALHDLERYANSEILQAIATALMVVFITTMISQAEAFAASYFFGTTFSQLTGAAQGGQWIQCGTDMIPVQTLSDSLTILQCRMKDRAEVFADLQEEIIDASAWPLWKYAFYWSIFGFPVIQGAYFGSLFKEIEQYRLLLSLTTNMLIATNTLAVFAAYIQANMLTFFLPLGLFLRAFHFTRGIGAFFMAIAIGFHFVFPIFYIITDPAYIKPGGYELPQPQEDQEVCYPTFTGLVRSFVGGGNAGSPLSATAETVTLETLKSDIARVYFAVILHPFIIFSITLVIVRQMMHFLGGEGQDLLRMASKVI